MDGREARPLAGEVRVEGDDQRAIVANDSGQLLALERLGWPRDDRFDFRVPDDPSEVAMVLRWLPSGLRAYPGQVVITHETRREWEDRALLCFVGAYLPDRPVPRQPDWSVEEVHDRFVGCGYDVGPIYRRPGEAGFGVADPGEQGRMDGRGLKVTVYDDFAGAYVDHLRAHSWAEALRKRKLAVDLDRGPWWGAGSAGHVRRRNVTLSQLTSMLPPTAPDGGPPRPRFRDYQGSPYATDRDFVECLEAVP